MATKSYLGQDQIKAAKKKFLRISPTSIRKKFTEPKVTEFSKWLGQRLFDALTEIPDWQLSEPIALGSWARDELCPRSDIDLLFGILQELAIENDVLVVEHNLYLLGRTGSQLLIEN